MSKIYDTLLGEYVKNPGVRLLALHKLAERNFNYEMISFDDLVKKNKFENFSEVELITAAKYSGEDVYITHKLFLEQEKNNIFLPFSRGLPEVEGIINNILFDIEIPLINVIKDIEIIWVKIDRDRLKELWTIFENQIIELSNSIYEEVWEEFNISSPKQVWEILFDKLYLPKWKKIKTGWSVNSDVLEGLSHEHPIAKKIIDYRHYSKLNSTYINWLIDLLDENDLLHTSYNQAITATWRFSSTNPNLQNIPSSSWIAWEIRSAFISRFEWWKIMAFDYSQVELRLLGIMSDDHNLLEAFRRWFDIHGRTAELIWTNDRKIAKAVNFWVVYWISGFWLSKMINISVWEANTYIKKFFESYPRVREFLDETIKFCEKNWYVETIFWRKRYISWINDSNRMIKSSAEREAINMPVQWTNADIIKIAMIRVWEYLKEKKLNSHMIMQVHDELVFDVYPWEEKILEKDITNIMENILIWKEITLKVEFEIGDNWREAK